MTERRPQRPHDSQQKMALEAESAALEADSVDQAEMRAVARLMASLQVPTGSAVS